MVVAFEPGPREIFVTGELLFSCNTDNLIFKRGPTLGSRDDQCEKRPSLKPPQNGFESGMRPHSGMAPECHPLPPASILAEIGVKVTTLFQPGA
jgi:hypothetical protein